MLTSVYLLIVCIFEMGSVKQRVFFEMGSVKQHVFFEMGSIKQLQTCPQTIGTRNPTTNCKICIPEGHNVVNKVSRHALTSISNCHRQRCLYCLCLVLNRFGVAGFLFGLLTFDWVLCN